MSYGLKALSTKDNLVLIDSESTPNKFVGKLTGGTKTYPCAAFGFDGTATWSYSFDDSCCEISYVSPIVPNSKVPILYIYTAIGTYARINGVSRNADGTWNISLFVYPDTGSAEIYCFCDAVNEAASSETYGMQLYNSVGQLTFDSGWGIECTNYVSYIAGAIGSTCTYPTTITKPAFCYSNLKMGGVIGAHEYIYGGSSRIGQFQYHFCTLLGRSSIGTFKTVLQGNFAYFVGSAASIWHSADDIAMYFPVIDCTMYDTLIADGI